MNRAFSLLASIYLLAACQRIPIVVDALVENPCSGEEIAFHFNELMISHDLEIVGRRSTPTSCPSDFEAEWQLTSRWPVARSAGCLVEGRSPR